MRQVLSASGTPDQAILIDYTDRVCKEILRKTRWKFLLSDIQVFTTVTNTSDYFFGTGAVPAGAVDTGLALTDVFTLKENSVYNMTDQRGLSRIGDKPLNTFYYQPDTPRLYRNSQASPYVISLYSPPNSTTRTINFQYYRTRTHLTDVSQFLQIPDDYKDVVCAGVNFFGYEYLKMKDDIVYWRARYEDGMRDMINDMNHFPKSNDFMKPDSAGIAQSLTVNPGVISLP